MSFRPSTPGDLLSQLLAAREMSQSECARRLGVSRRRVIALMKGRHISAAMARKLGEVFGVDWELWLLMQRQAELWDELHGAGEGHKNTTAPEDGAGAA